MPGFYFLVSMKNTFRKRERITNKKTINRLFTSGKSISSFPYRIIWDLVKENENSPAQITIAVPKKKFSKAVDRNSLKRKMREAYRKNKEIIYNPLIEKKIFLACILIYTGNELISYEEIENKMIVSLRKLVQQLTDIKI